MLQQEGKKVARGVINMFYDFKSDGTAPNQNYWSSIGHPGFGTALVEAVLDRSGYLD